MIRSRVADRRRLDVFGGLYLAELAAGFVRGRCFAYDFRTAAGRVLDVDQAYVHRRAASLLACVPDEEVGAWLCAM